MMPMAPMPAKKITPDAAVGAHGCAPDHGCAPNHGCAPYDDRPPDNNHAPNDRIPDDLKPYPDINHRLSNHHVLIDDFAIIYCISHRVFDNGANGQNRAHSRAPLHLEFVWCRWIK